MFIFKVVDLRVCGHDGVVKGGGSFSFHVFIVVRTTIFVDILSSDVYY